MHTKLSYKITDCQILFHLIQVQGKHDLTSYKIMWVTTIGLAHERSTQESKTVRYFIFTNLFDTNIRMNNDDDMEKTISWELW